MTFSELLTIYQGQATSLVPYAELLLGFSIAFAVVTRTIDIAVGNFKYKKS